MSEEDNVTDDTEKVTTEEVVKTEEVEDTSAQEESEDGLVEKNKKLFERAKKAEAEAKEWKAKANTKAETKTEPSEKQDGLSTEDVYSLFEAKVPKDDIDVVKKYAKLNDLSIGDALKDDIVKVILKEKAEQRKSAEVANTGGSRRGSTKVSDETLLSNAAKGIYPENPEDLVNAQFRIRKGK